MLAKLVLLLVTLSFIAIPRSAQPQLTPPPPVKPPGPPPSPGRPESVQDTGLYGYWTHMTDSGRAGAALLGKVVIEGEMLPWDPILVTVACKGNTAYTTQTDPRGVFAVQPSKVAGELSQQGDVQRQMQVHYEGCVVEAFLTGFRSTSLPITVHSLRDDPTLGTLTLSRDSSARAVATSATRQTAPPSAAQAWSKAGQEMLAGKPGRARKELEKAVRDYPQFADAWYELGRMQVLSSPRDARTCFERAIAADPKFVLPFEQLASLSLQQEDWEKAVENTNRSLQLDSEGTARIWYFSALANYQLGRFDAAESNAKRLLFKDPLHNIRNGEQLLAAILARKADYAGALSHLRNCLTYITDAPEVTLLKEQIAQLQKRVPTPN